MRPISIASLQEVIKNLEYIENNDINLISIRDYDHSPFYTMIDNGDVKNLLVIQFDDLVEDLPKEYQRQEKPPSESDIVKILEWAKLKMAENDKPFIVHCSAGVSRSSAVAILVNYLQDPEHALKVINPLLHSPNEKVLELGEKILGTNTIKQPTKDLLKKHDDAWMKSWDNVRRKE